jgi:hypothetical protein
MPAARTEPTTTTLLQRAETRIRGELERNGMHPADATRVAGERVKQGLLTVQREHGNEIGFLSQIDEAGLAVLEAGGFGAASNAAAKITGSPTASSQVGKAAQAVEQKGVEGAEKAPGAIGNPILEALTALVGTYGLRLGEVLAGAALVLFGLVTLANGGKAPKPGVVPVPV